MKLYTDIKPICVTPFNALCILRDEHIRFHCLCIHSSTGLSLVFSHACFVFVDIR